MVITEVDMSVIVFLFVALFLNKLLIIWQHFKGMYCPFSSCSIWPLDVIVDEVLETTVHNQATTPNDTRFLF